MFELHFIELIFTIFIYYFSWLFGLVRATSNTLSHISSSEIDCFLIISKRPIAGSRLRGQCPRKAANDSRRERGARATVQIAAQTPPLFCKNGITHSVDTVHFLQGTPGR